MINNFNNLGYTMINKTQYINELQNTSKRLLKAIDQKHENFINNFESIATQEYKQYITNRLKNPVMTAIVMNDVLKNNPPQNNDTIMNLIRLEKHPEIDTLIKSQKQNRDNYKKTAKLRSKIIEYERINTKNITPKLKKLEKIIFKIKLLFK